MNAPAELRGFEMEMETLIKDVQWKPMADKSGKE
jgi:hypothetical protein